MPKVNNKKDLPKWFNLDNYNQFNDLSNNELLNQLYLRAELLLTLNSDYFKREAFLNEWQNSRDGIIWQQITNSSPIINMNAKANPTNPQLNDDWLKKFLIDDNEQLSISSSPAIHGVSVNTAIQFAKKINGLDIMVKRPLWGDIDCFPDRLASADINILGKDVDHFFRTKKVHLTINLDGFTDKELISQFTELLPYWRKSLGANYPKESILSKPSSLAKVLKYNVIPLFDLYAWSEIMGHSIPHRIYTVALYPNGEKGETEFKQTILPFTFNVFSDSCRGH